MATFDVRKTSDGRTRVRARVRVKGAPTITNTLPTKAAAKRWAQQIEAEVRAGRMLPRLESDRHTLDEAIERYLENDLLELSANERRNRRQQLSIWSEHLGSLTLLEVTPARIIEFLDRLSAGRITARNRLSASTVNRYRSALSAVLEVAYKSWEWVDSNPVARVKPRKESRGRDRFLSRDELDKLLEACRSSLEPRLYGIVRVALATGARRTEVMHMRWTDVDLLKGKVLLRETKNNQTRVVHLHGEAIDLIREAAKTPSISGFVWGVGKTRASGPTFPKHAWYCAMSEASLVDFRFHDLRHTAASYLAMSGATLPELAAFLGHKTLNMVARYAHLTDSHSREVSRRMVESFLS